ncbi:hypothetical protein MA16_Dca009344 [Dendrobium catenatum]|uniref:Uncharacterized protein n=1 Tax=Dendrobium catenatum TaxID=906689 RepID=A0A2I0XH03_9ASPA|nr:hypothetical protein MA16_Dca009344 [Dendrobium catenatum]
MSGQLASSISDFFSRHLMEFLSKFPTIFNGLQSLSLTDSSNETSDICHAAVIMIITASRQWLIRFCILMLLSSLAIFSILASWLAPQHFGP